jgi:hypothetical protein
LQQVRKHVQTSKPLKPILTNELANLYKEFQELLTARTRDV